MFASHLQSTVCMSLLQPQRETYNLFDDVMLLSDGETLLCQSGLSGSSQR